MAKRLLMIEGSEERLDLIEKEIAKNKGELGYNVVDIGYNYDEDGGWCFGRFLLDSFVKEAISVDWIEDYYKYRVMPRTVEWFEAIQIMVEDWKKENADL